MRLSSHAGVGPRHMSTHAGGGGWPGGVGGLPPGPLGASSTLFGKGEYSQDIKQEDRRTLNYSGSYGASLTGYFVVDRAAAALTPGTAISDLMYYDATGGNNITLYIVERVSAGNYRVALNVEVPSTSNGGYNKVALGAVFTVPATGEYRTAVYVNSGNSYYSGSAYSRGYRAYKPSDGETFGSVTEDSNTVGGPGIVYVVQFQSSYTSTEVTVTGQTATASSEYSGSYTAANAFNGACGTTADYWQTAVGVTTAWLKATYSIKRRITRYQLEGGTNLGLSAMPSSWTLEGSNDGGATWNVLDTRSGISFAVACSWQSYTVASPGEYLAYRLNIAASGGANYLGISEMQFFESYTFTNAIVITSAATVAPDALTFACVVKGHTLVLDGASASLKPSTKCNGLYAHLTGDLVLLNGATCNIDGLGKGGTVTGSKSEVDVLPDSMKAGLALAKLANYVMVQPGASGGAGGPPSGPSYNQGTVGGTGAAAGPMQTGGGGGGGSGNYDVNLGGGDGGPGTSFGGGAGGGGAPRHSTGGTAGGDATAALAGGVGGGNTAGNGGGGGGGAGDPVGAGGAQGPGSPGTGGPGGVLMAFVKGWIKVASGCRISSDGSAGGAAYPSTGGGGGGGSGGGLVGLFYLGGYTNNGTVRANGGLGGAKGAAETYNCPGGPGGPGSVNIINLAA